MLTVEHASDDDDVVTSVALAMLAALEADPRWAGHEPSVLFLMMLHAWPCRLWGASC